MWNHPSYWYTILLCWRGREERRQRRKGGRYSNSGKVLERHLNSMLCGCTMAACVEQLQFQVQVVHCVWHAYTCLVCKKRCGPHFPGAGEKLDQRVWSSTWRGDLVVPPMSQTWGLLNTFLSPVLSLALYFNHLHYKCPQKGPATFHPCSYLHPVLFASCLGFFSSILLERDIQGHLRPCERTSRSTPGPFLSHQPPFLCNPELFIFKASSYFLVFTYALPSARKIQFTCSLHQEVFPEKLVQVASLS